MTYLELVNGVLRRLRETQVSTVSENDYSALMGDLVNDAKSIVENAHSWSALRTDITFNTVSGTSTYSLTGSGSDTEVRDAMDTTAGVRLNTSNRTHMNNVYHLNTPAAGKPTMFAFTGVDSAGDMEVQLYPQPNGIFTMRFDAFVGQGLLTADATNVSIPHNPVIQLAFGMALRERGETGGQSAAEQFQVADTVLSDAIAFDANKYSEDTTYVAV